MAEGVVQLLLVQLGTLVNKEYTHMKGLQIKVEYIKAELKSMCAFLRYAEAEQDAGRLDDLQKECCRDVMKVAYDIEDIVDKFLLRFPERNDVGFRGNVRGMYTEVKNLPYRHWISSDIGKIKTRVKEISERHQRYALLIRASDNFQASSKSNIILEHPIRGHALLIREADLVGIDSPKREIISKILSNASHRKVFSVLGMGGLGKTTLVKRVYEAPDVKREFTVHAWLTISQTFIIEDALKNLIHQLSKEVKQPIPSDMDSMNGVGLRTFVNDFLKDKRYIIVLDDIWETRDWDSIKYVFPDDNCGSRIIITTRIEEVATAACHRDNVHMMQRLSSDDSWELLRKQIFGDAECPSYLVDTSRSIMKKCNGLPLGIVVIGGVLASKKTKTPIEWDKVLRSLGGELEGQGKLDPVRDILLLSYNDLPYYLKCCLLYMGMFPEDAIVKAKDLIYLWMAEGFVKVGKNMTREEVARDFLNDLVGRSLIQAEEISPDGKIVSCRVHDLTFHYIILLKCKEYNILSAAFTSNIEQPENVRRLVVDKSTLPGDPVDLPRLRSIITRPRFTSSISDSSLSKLLQGTSNLLKVLHLKSSNLNVIPDEVFELSNLTYINLEGTNVTTISRRIRMLQNIEYLSLNCKKVIELPDDITKLKKLNYLGIGSRLHHFNVDFSRLGFKAPKGLGELVSLHHLHYIEADNENVLMEIGKLTQLRSLGIMKVIGANGRELCSTLEKLTNLQELSIKARTQKEFIDLDYSLNSNLQFLSLLKCQGRLTKIPNWVPSCFGLSTLCLVHSRLTENPLTCLESMTNLTYLQLSNAYTGDTLNFKAGGFQNLKTLWLTKLSGLTSIRFEKGALPELDNLSIDRCKLIKELPKDLQYLTNLKKLLLRKMSTELVNSLQSLNKESDGYQKIAHISTIHIVSKVDGKLKHDYLKW